MAKSPSIIDTPYRKKGGILQLKGSYKDYQISIKDSEVILESAKYFPGEQYKFTDLVKLFFDDIGTYIIDSNLPLPVDSKIDHSNYENPIVVGLDEVTNSDISYTGSPLSISGIYNQHGLTTSTKGDKLCIKLDPTYKKLKYFSYNLKNADNVMNLSPSRVYINEPNYPQNEEFFDQWYIEDINLLPVIDKYLGKGIKVAVLDTGFAPEHEGITMQRYNYIFRHGYMHEHALNVASIIGAKRNSKYIAGIAPAAELISLQLPFGEHADIEYGVFKEFDVINNSWGSVFPFGDNIANRFDAAESIIFMKAIKNAVAKGRDGFGSNIVFSSGNYRFFNISANYDFLKNSPYVITVGGISKSLEDSYNEYAPQDFASYGTSILVSAPASNIRVLSNTNHEMTTDGKIISTNTTKSVDGTSFSAPIVSAIIALMLEANPKLGWRDVQEILAYSANSVEDLSSITSYEISNDNINESDEVALSIIESVSPILQGARGCKFNSATNHNGGGLHTSYKYGFGEVDATAAIQLAKYWPKEQTSKNLIKASFLAPNIIKKIMNSERVIESQFKVAHHNPVEFVSLNFDSLHPYIQDLEVWITSPSGTKSLLLDRPGIINELRLDIYKSLGPSELNWDFGSHQFRGEDPYGNWIVSIVQNSDRGTPHILFESGIINSLNLTIAMKDEVLGQQMIFTDEFSKYTDSQREDISIASNISILNLSAVSSASNIDLTGKTKSTIGDKAFTLKGGSHINSVIAADNKNIIIGSNPDCIYHIHGGINDIYLADSSGTVEFDHLDRSIGYQRIYNFETDSARIKFADGTDPSELDKYNHTAGNGHIKYSGIGWSIELIGSELNTPAESAQFNEVLVASAA